jgi:hypothetical protein
MVTSVAPEGSSGGPAVPALAGVVLTSALIVSP